MLKESTHYIQTQIWADVKKESGWKNHKLRTSDGSTFFVYERTIPTLGKLFYMPCIDGITTANAESFTKLLKEKFAKKGFVLRLELHQIKDDTLMSKLTELGWKISQTHAQYRHTILIDLSPTEEEIWMSFKSRGRYEVLQAQKAGVVVNEVDPNSNNLKRMYDLMALTSDRNKFFIRDKAFTMLYWNKFAAVGQLKLFFATLDDEVLAGSIILINGTEAWNKDGGSTREKAHAMAPRLIQWEVMKVLKKEGIKTYDLGGIADPESFKNSRIPGIYIFKSGFSKETTAFMPTLELPLSSKYVLWPKGEKQWLRIYNLFAHNLWW
jgi:lipid II:glycine glycyltransferase (peptidoglycan interpeptide bridge formation enzyme)